MTIASAVKQTYEVTRMTPDEPRDLVFLSGAERMLAEARTLDDVRQVLDLAEAARLYAKKHHLGLEAQNHAGSIAVEAAIRQGEILAQMAEQGQRQRPGMADGSRSEPSVPTLADLNTTKRESADAQALANQAEAVREWVAGAKEITPRKAASVARKAKRENDPPPPPTALPPGRFDVILADPPWQYDFIETDNRAIENQYPTLSVEDICAYHDDFGRPILDAIADDAILFLWATNPKLREALRVVEAWGFEYVTNAVWIKDRIGMGYWVRQQHELLLICRRGRVSPPDPETRRSSVIEAPYRGHSVKPDEVYELIEAMLPAGRRLECFARRGRPGWTPFGNESVT